MKKFLLTIALFVLILLDVYSQVNCRFIVHTNGIKDSSDVYITGNHPLLGNWNPTAIALLKINDSTWSGEFQFNRFQQLQFKFTLGSWDKEALDPDREKFPNTELIAKNDTTLVFHFSNWGSEKRNTKGGITGNVQYHRNFPGTNIPPRDVIVWLPPSYDSLISKRYPVLYMNDGQNIIDPSTSAFGVDWQMDETADSLIRKNEITELIIVGIYNTSKRSLEYSNSELGTAYMNFIVRQLKAYIDSTYRTLSDRENTAICGSSLGGLNSFMVAWEFDSVFSKAACFSPALKVDRFDYLAPVKKYTGPKKDIKLYIDNGGKGVDDKLQPGIDQMLVALTELGYEINEDILWIKDEESDHSESAWAKRVPLMLKFLFPSSN